MLLRMSTLLLKTLREEPADAEVPSHRLLLRAGYIRRAAPGGYTWLPLGKLVLDRVTAVVRAEMTAIGGQEVSFPALLPREPYEISNRWTEYGDDIFTLHGPARRRLSAGAHPRGDVHPARAGHDQLLPGLPAAAVPDPDEVPRRGPAAGRPAARPRVPDEGRLLVLPDRRRPDRRSYAAMRAAYQRIFARLGLSHTIVSAMSGAMGGSASEEFLATAEVGEDTFVGCTSCDYAANTEAVVTPAPAPPADRRPARPDRARHPGHPDDRLAGRSRQRRALGRPHRLDRRRHPQERRGHRAPPRPRGRAAGDRRARRPRGGPQAARRRARPGHRHPVRRLRRPARPGQGLHRPAGHQGSAIWPTRGWRPARPG